MPNHYQTCAPRRQNGAGWTLTIKGDNEKSPVAHWTLHDLRRTASTQWAEIGIPQHINDRLLNHVTGGNQSRVARIYNRYEYLMEKREAILLWEKRVTELVARVNV